MKRTYILIATAVALTTAGLAQASDTNPPAWRGNPGTTMQQWLFESGDIPAAPSIADNPYGAPTASVIGGSAPDTQWLSQDVGTGRDGVWQLYDAAYLKVDVPNTDNTDIGTYKNIWIQLTFSAAFGYSPDIIVTAAGDVSPVQIESAPVLLEDETYYRATYSVHIEPNPTSETIYIQPRDCELKIDELIVDTVCVVPEPTSMLLLAACGVLIRRR